MNSRFLAILLLSVVVLLGTSLTAEQISYPASKTVDVVDTLHGVPVPDPYRWLEDTDDPAVQEWTDQQNALTRSLLDAIPQREDVKARLAELWSYTQTSAPAKYGERYFFTRKTGLQDHAVIYYTEGLDSDPIALIDPNSFEGDRTAAVNFWHVSPQGEMVAYGVSEAGSEVATIYVKEVATQQDLPLQIHRCRYSSVIWEEDASGFYYTRLPAVGEVPEGDEHYFRRIYYHKLGDDVVNDPCIWRDDEVKENSPGLSRSEDHNYMFMMLWYSSIEENTLYYMDLNKRDVFHPMVPDFGSTNIPAMIDTIAYIMTTDGAPNRKIMWTNIKTPEREHWDDLIPESEDLLESFTIINRHLVLQYLHNAYHEIRIHTLGGRLVKTIELPTLGTVSQLSGTWDEPELFFKFQSFNYPRTNFRYDFNTEALEAIETIEIDVNPEDYESQQVWYTSKDGTEIPMFVVHKKGIELNGSNPTLLYGYGGFFSNQTPWFSGSYSYLLENGIVLAVPNLRGGGEFGEKWHRAGMLEQKQNTFDDFIAAAKWLIANKYTNPARLAIRGGSNGGLLVGAVMVQRPELFKVVMCGVPLLDMLRYHQFLIARFWIPEYGSADDPEQFKYIHEYSPYHNIKDGVSYPATILTAGESDGRVHPLHARKMAAALQKADTGDNPLLLWVQRRAGHGQGKPTSMALEESADEWTFLLWQLGVFE
jgi:prolyl oligopeptidase